MRVSSLFITIFIFFASTDLRALENFVSIDQAGAWGEQWEFFGINNHGVIVGARDWDGSGALADQLPEPVIIRPTNGNYDSDGIIGPDDYEVLPHLGLGGRAYDVNGKGLVVGFVYRDCGPPQPCETPAIWQEGELFTIPSPYGNGTAWIPLSDGSCELRRLDPTPVGYASEVNDNGDVLGSIDVRIGQKLSESEICPSRPIRTRGGFVWSGGAPEIIGQLAAMGETTSSIGYHGAERIHNPSPYRRLGEDGSIVSASGEVTYVSRGDDCDCSDRLGPDWNCTSLRGENACSAGERAILRWTGPDSYEKIDAFDSYGVYLGANDSGGRFGGVIEAWDDEFYIFEGAAGGISLIEKVIFPEDTTAHGIFRSAGGAGGIIFYTIEFRVSGGFERVQLQLYNPRDQFGLDAGTHIVDSAGAGPRPIAVNELGQIVFLSGIGLPRGTVLQPPGLALPDPPPPTRFYYDADFIAPNHEADPVNTFNGSFVMPERVDLHVGGPADLRFKRSYDSGGPSVKSAGDLGIGWRHGFEWRLEYRADDDEVVVHDWRGGRAFFEPEQNGAWVTATPGKRHFQLVEDADRWRVLDGYTDTEYEFDAKGQLTAIVRKSGARLDLSYDSDRLTTVADAYGNWLDFEWYEPFDPSFGSYVRRVTDSFGRSLVFFHSYASGMVVTNVALEADEFRVSNKYRYTIDGYLEQIIEPNGKSYWRNVYDDSGRVIAQRDPYGRMIDFDYGSDFTTTLTYPDGSEIVHRHNAEGTLVEYSAGNYTPIEVNRSASQASITNARGEYAQSIHEPTGTIATRTTPDGAFTKTYTERQLRGFTYYDLTEMSLPDGTQLSYAYDAEGRLTSLTDASGANRTQAHAENGRVETVTFPNGARTLSEFDANGRKVAFTNLRQVETSYSYDKWGHINSTELADGSTLETEYDPRGLPLRFTDEVGRVTLYRYDDSGLVRETEAPSGAMTRFFYDKVDNLVRVVDAEGREVLYEYDARGNVVSVTDGEGRRIDYSWDARELPVSTTQPSGATWQRAYDSSGRMLSETGPMQLTFTQEFGPHGPTRVTGTDGESVDFQYDALGRIISVSGPPVCDVAYTRDEVGRIMKITAEGGMSTTLERDVMGFVTSVEGPSGSTWTYEYEPDGAVASVTDPLERTESYVRDQRGRIVEVSYPGDESATIDWLDGVRPLKMTYSDGTEHVYEYDVDGFLESTTGYRVSHDRAGLMSNSNGVEILRDGSGGIASLRYGAELAIDYAYDSDGNLLTVTDWTGRTTSFELDPRARVSVAGYPNGISASFSYDAIGDLLGVDWLSSEGSVGSMAWTRDARGNPLTEEVEGLLEPEPPAEFFAYSVNAAYQVGSFDYDARGRVVDDGDWTYEWAGNDQLVSLSDEDETISFEYDAFNLPIAREEHFRRLEFVWNYAFEQPRLSMIFENGQPYRYFIYSNVGELLYSASPEGDARFYHWDDAGNLVMTTDEAGEIVGRYAWTPFGRPAGLEGEPAEFIGFAGRFGAVRIRADLYRMGVRVYDARSRRFVSPEPRRGLLHPHLLNPYQYALNNPKTYVDSSGEKPEPTASERFAQFDEAQKKVTENVDKYLRGDDPVIKKSPLAKAAQESANAAMKRIDTLAQRADSRQLKKLNALRKKLQAATDARTFTNGFLDDVSAINGARSNLEKVLKPLEWKRKADKIAREGRAQIDSTLQGHIKRERFIQQALRDKEITVEQAQRMSNASSEQFHEQIERDVADWQYDTAELAARAAMESAKEFIPSNKVGDTANFVIDASGVIE